MERVQTASRMNSSLEMLFSILLNKGREAYLPAFKAKKHPMTRKNWNAHGVIVTYRVTPRVYLLNTWQFFVGDKQ
jgi:hypothetical protein